MSGTFQQLHESWGALHRVNGERGQRGDSHSLMGRAGPGMVWILF